MLHASRTTRQRPKTLQDNAVANKRFYSKHHGIDTSLIVKNVDESSYAAILGDLWSLLNKEENRKLNAS